MPHPQTEPLGISPCPSAWGKREETMLWGLESAGPISHCAAQPSTLRTSQGASPWLNSPRTQRATTLGTDWKVGRWDLPSCLSLHSTPCLLWSGPTPTRGHLAPVVKDSVRKLCLQERKAPVVGETLRCLRPAHGPKDGGGTSGSWGHSSGSNSTSTTDKHRP